MDFFVSAPGSPQSSTILPHSPLALSLLPMAIATGSLTISAATPINCNNEQASHLRRLSACSLAASKFV